MKIEWLLSGTAREWREEEYKDGGAVYEAYVRKALRERHNVAILYSSRGSHRLKVIRIVQFASFVVKNLRRRYKGDLIIRDFFSTVFAPFDTRRKNIVILHHLDPSSTGYRFLYRWMTRRFLRRMRLADAIIVVSEYWRNVLEKAGATNVMVINNSFDLDKFEFTSDELLEFRKKWGFDGQRPVIYLGNARPEKGYLEAFEALNGIDATFVATGKSETPKGIHRLFLSYTDYLKLLKISSVVLTMSKFDEGWCRTAHEAMLCGTPVIGSGRGGMGELLLKGGQIICRDFSSLRPALLELIID